MDDDYEQQMRNEHKVALLAQAKQTLFVILNVLSHRLLVVIALVFNAVLCAVVLYSPGWDRIVAEGLFAIASFALVRFKG